MAAAVFYIIKNNISDLGWLNSVHINLPAVNLRATVLQSRRSVKNEWQAAWLLRAVTCIDLTTLGGDDTRSNVARLCAKVTFMYVFNHHNQPKHQQPFCVVVVFCDVMPCMIMASWDVTPCSRSYRPISLLPVLSKLFEKLFLTRIKPTLQEKSIIPDHQFGFRQKHATIEQAHRITNVTHNALESNKYCTAAFLDISQVFDKVWHEGVLYKIKTIFSDSIYKVLKSYLESRYILIKYREEYTSLYPVLSGLPQGSVLVPLLDLLCTADLPTTTDSTTATFTDNTAVLTAHEDPAITTHRLQTNLNEIQLWLKKWHMKVNETKSVQVTFTLKQNTCPHVQLNNKQLTKPEDIKCLRINLDQKLTWRKCKSTTRKQLDIELRKLYWIIGRKSSYHWKINY